MREAQQWSSKWKPEVGKCSSKKNRSQLLWINKERIRLKWILIIRVTQQRMWRQRDSYARIGNAKVSLNDGHNGKLLSGYKVSMLDNRLRYNFVIARFIRVQKVHRERRLFESQLNLHRGETPVVLPVLYILHSFRTRFSSRRITYFNA